MKYKTLVDHFRLLAGRKRLEILKLLADGRPRSVGEIAERINLSLKSTSKHVLLLAQGDLLESKRVRYSVLYRFGSEAPAYLKPILNVVRSCK